MAKPQGNFPIGKSTKINVAVQRPNVNLKESENVGEQAQAELDRFKRNPVTFSRHGTMAYTPHPIDAAYED